MTHKFAINGFGRIGRSVFRALHQGGPFTNLQCQVINAGIGDPQTYFHLLKYDSVHGRFDVALEGDELVTSLGRFKLIFETDPSSISWGEYGVDFVIESTGKFTSHQLASAHLQKGVKAVLVSAPCDNADATIVYGVNDHSLKREHQVISVGSCTTNCLAPVAKVLHENLEIKHGFMTTIHSYTNDQSLVDAVHKDKRRARAAALSMIPSSTGAAKAIGLVLPELAGKLDGASIRVPTPNVSLVDLKVEVAKSSDAATINSLMKQAVASMKGALDYTEEELVSIDFNGDPHSSIFDATQTKVIGGNFVRVASWYDNEWGFSNRMLDVMHLLGKIHA